MSLAIRAARPGDERLVLAFIRKLAEYEKLLDEVVADEVLIGKSLFGLEPKVFCDIAEWSGEPAGFALWFYNYSTFHARHGIYLEDLFVEPHFRGQGIGKALLKNLARRWLDAAPVVGAHLERAVNLGLQGARRSTVERMDGVSRRGEGA